VSQISMYVFKNEVLMLRDRKELVLLALQIRTSPDFYEGSH
jgi:hypothetical protein